MWSATLSLDRVVTHAGLVFASGPAGLPAPRVAQRDPLSINLPPGPGSDLSPAAVAHLGALYLFSQLDQGGIIVAVEALVDSRANLSLRDDRAAEDLDRFALDAHGFPNRNEREAIYARVFGAGGQASLSTSANHDFPSQMAAVCNAVVRIAADLEMARGAPSVSLFAPLAYAVQQLMEGLALHAGVDVTYRAQRIHTMLARALAILQLDGITSYFGAHNAADVVRVVLGSAAGDLGSAQRRGLAGQQLIIACGRAAGHAGMPAALLTGSHDPIVGVAAQWLADSGVASVS
jgi:hypothetical protein